jgi:hypothetical protein
MKTELGFFAISLMALAACNGTDQNGGLGNNLGTDELSGTPISINPGNNSTGSTPSSMVGTGCHSNDPNQICIGVKFVTFKDSAGTPTVTQNQAIADMATTNVIWKQCNIAFQIDEYSAVAPGDSNLEYATSSFSALDTIRNQFNDGKTFLVAVTGQWVGALNTNANAWTNLPGSGSYGAIFESSVGTYGNIVAHELGHYLNLDHVNDQSDVMNPVIYDNSIGLYNSQCSAARAAATGYWGKMLR